MFKEISEYLFDYFEIPKKETKKEAE